MSPEAAYALEQHVARRKIRDNEVEIYIHALLYHLGSNEDAAESTGGPVRSEVFEPILFQVGTTLKGKAAV